MGYSCPYQLVWLQLGIHLITCKAIGSRIFQFLCNIKPNFLANIQDGETHLPASTINFYKSILLFGLGFMVCHGSSTKSSSSNSMNQLKLADLVNLKSMLCASWNQHSNLKIYKTKYEFKNGKLILIKTCFASVSLLVRKTHLFVEGLLPNVLLNLSMWGPVILAT